jgi:hypothetical protein
MDLKELMALTIPKLRDEAKKIEGITGVLGMDKPHLIEVIAAHQNIQLPRGHAISADGRKFKPQLSKLKAKRRAQFKEKKFDQARLTRKNIKRTLRKMKTAK